MTLINVLPLEEYLYGVVPYEIQSKFPSGSLKSTGSGSKDLFL